MKRIENQNSTAEQQFVLNSILSILASIEIEKTKPMRKEERKIVAALVRKHERELHEYSILYCRCPHTAKDLLSKVIFKYCVRLRWLKPHSFLPYVKTMIKNTYINRKGNIKQKHNRSYAEITPAIEARLHEKPTSDLVTKIFGYIPNPKTRQIANLFNQGWKKTQIYKEHSDITRTDVDKAIADLGNLLDGNYTAFAV